MQVLSNQAKIESLLFVSGSEGISLTEISQLIGLLKPAVQIGTANFIDPAVTIKVEDGINNYLERHGCKSVKEIIGALEV